MWQHPPWSYTLIPTTTRFVFSGRLSTGVLRWGRQPSNTTPRRCLYRSFTHPGELAQSSAASWPSVSRRACKQHCRTHGRARHAVLVAVLLVVLQAVQVACEVAPLHACATATRVRRCSVHREALLTALR